jgi:hypothetical protein
MGSDDDGDSGYEPPPIVAPTPPVTEPVVVAVTDAIAPSLAVAKPAPAVSPPYAAFERRLCGTPSRFHY